MGRTAHARARFSARTAHVSRTLHGTVGKQGVGAQETPGKQLWRGLLAAVQPSASTQRVPPVPDIPAGQRPQTDTPVTLSSLRDATGGG